MRSVRDEFTVTKQNAGVHAALAHICRDAPDGVAAACAELLCTVFGRHVAGLQFHDTANVSRVGDRLGRRLSQQSEAAGLDCGATAAVAAPAGTNPISAVSGNLTDASCQPGAALQSAHRRYLLRNGGRRRQHKRSAIARRHDAYFEPFNRSRDRQRPASDTRRHQFQRRHDMYRTVAARVLWRMKQ